MLGIPPTTEKVARRRRTRRGCSTIADGGQDAHPSIRPPPADSRL